MFNPKAIGKDERKLKALTEISLSEFEKLLLVGAVGSSFYFVMPNCAIKAFGPCPSGISP